MEREIKIIGINPWSFKDKEKGTQVNMTDIYYVFPLSDSAYGMGAGMTRVSAARAKTMGVDINQSYVGFFYKDSGTKKDVLVGVAEVG